MSDKTLKLESKVYIDSCDLSDLLAEAMRDIDRKRWLLDSELDKDDPLSVLTNRARALGITIRDYALDQGIEMYGGKWLDPARFSPHTEQLVDVFSRVSLPPSYKDWQDQRRQKLVRALSSQKSFQDAALHWPDLSMEEREAIIRKTVHAHYNLYCANQRNDNKLRLRLSFVSEARPEAENAYFGLGAFSQRGTLNNIEMNTHEDAMFDNFANIMYVLHHESTHMVQQAFCNLYQDEDAERDSDANSIARFWYLFKNERRSYITHILPVYRCHPLEVDAFDQGQNFTDEIRAALKEQGIDTPAYIPVGSTASYVSSPLIRYQKLLPAPQIDIG